MKLMFLVILLALTIPYCAVAQYDEYTPAQQTAPITRSIEGTYISYDIEITDDSVILTDIRYTYENQEFALFSQIVVDVENGFDYPFDSIPMGDDGFKLTRQGLHLSFNDTENSELRIISTSGYQIEVKIRMTPGARWEAPSKDSISMLISDDQRLTIAWSENSVVRVEKTQETVDVSFLLERGGKIHTRLSGLPPDTEQNIPEISIDRNGKLTGEGAGISVMKKNAVKGDIELTVSKDTPGSRIIHLNLSRELIGSNINDLSNIKVAVNGEDIEYIGADKFYDTEEQGYYVSIVDGETHVYFNVNDVEQDVKIYEVSQDVTSTAESLSFTEMIGITIGIVVVMAGMTALFFKKKE